MRISDRVEQRAPESVLRVIRPFYYRIIGPIYRLADERELIGPNEIYSTEYYAKRREDPWRSDAHEVARTLNDVFEPNSVIDFGCAIGAHLEPFYENGVTIRGVEGNKAAFEHALVPTKFLDRHDLREPYTTKERFDLALCFEVAEHLPERFADTLVKTLTSAGETVVMTAAPPGQGGTHHVNEQQRNYWIDKFAEYDFDYDGQITDQLQSSIQVEKTVWVPENLFVFRC